MSTKKPVKKSAKKVTVKLTPATEKLPHIHDDPVVRKAFFDLATLVSRLVALAHRELDAYEKGVLGPLATMGKALEEAAAREGAHAAESVPEEKKDDKDDLGLDVKAILEGKPTRRARKPTTARMEVHGARPSSIASGAAPRVVGAPPDLE